jgi:hypothetical protein
MFLPRRPHRSRVRVQFWHLGWLSRLPWRSAGSANPRATLDATSIVNIAAEAVKFVHGPQCQRLMSRHCHPRGWRL